MDLNPARLTGGVNFTTFLGFWADFGGGRDEKRDELGLGRPWISDFEEFRLEGGILGRDFVGGREESKELKEGLGLGLGWELRAVSCSSSSSDA